MVPDARSQTPRTEGAADINIKARLEAEGAESADNDRFFDRGVENKGVCARKRMHADWVMTVERL
jgi:hypothetical protein